MRGIGNDDPAPLRCLAALRVIGLEHEERRELGLRAGGWLQRHVIHPRDLREHLLELVGEREHALRGPVRLAGVQVREQRGGAIVHLRVVFHRARSKWVHPCVDGVVQLREVRVVADHLRLHELGQWQRRLALELFRDLRDRVGADVSTRAAGSRELEEQRLERLRLAGTDVRDRLAPQRCHRAATACREPVISATASTSASMSESVVSSVHWMITSSRPRRRPASPCFAGTE